MQELEKANFCRSRRSLAKNFAHFVVTAAVFFFGTHLMTCPPVYHCLTREYEAAKTNYPCSPADNVGKKRFWSLWKVDVRLKVHVSASS